MKDYRIYNKKKYFYTKHPNIFKSEDGIHYAYRLYLPEIGVDTFCIQDKVTKKKFTSDIEALEHQLAERKRRMKSAVVTMSDNTVDFVWQEMLETAQKSAGTIRKHTSVYTHHIKPVFGSTKIKDLNVGAIKTLLATLYVVGDGACGREGGYSYGFVEGILKWFYWFYNYSYENKYMDKEQFEEFFDTKEKMPPKRKASDNEKIRILKSAEIAAIFKLLEGTDLYLPALITLCTGARTSENFCLCWQDINFSTKKLSINKRIVEEPGGILVISTPKTDQTTRDVDMPDILIEALYKKKQEQIEGKKANPELWAKNRMTIIENRELNRKPMPMPDFINVDKNGKYIKPSAFNPYAKQIREKICPNQIGIEDFSFYTFRKTHISNMASRLTELTLIKHTGHKKISSVQNFYDARTEEDDRRISESLKAVNNFYRSSMSINETANGASGAAPAEGQPLYIKPKPIIPDTSVPLQCVPIDKIKQIFKETNNPPDKPFTMAHPYITLDCATLSPIGCYSTYVDATSGYIDNMDSIVIIYVEESSERTLDQSIIDAFAKEHIILE